MIRRNAPCLPRRWVQILSRTGTPDKSQYRTTICSWFMTSWAITFSKRFPQTSFETTTTRNDSLSHPLHFSIDTSLAAAGKSISSIHCARPSGRRCRHVVEHAVRSGFLSSLQDAGTGGIRIGTDDDSRNRRRRGNGAVQEKRSLSGLLGDGGTDNPR